MNFWGINGMIFVAYSLICYLYKKEKIFLNIAFIHLTFIAAFRGIKVGTDTYNYCKIYMKIADGTFNGSGLVPKGSLLQYYYKLVSFILPKENGYMLSTSIPTMIGFYFLIKKYVKNYYFGVYLFVAGYIYFFSMNAGRQMLAVSFTIISFVLWNDRKYIFSFLAYFVAIQIHNSAIIFGVFYLISIINWNLLIYIVYLIGVFIACKSINFFVSIFVRLFPRYKWMLRRSFIYDLSSGGRLSLIYAAICIFSILVMLYWIIYSKYNFRVKINYYVYVTPKVKMNENEVQFYFKIMAVMWISAVLYLIYPSVILFTRISYYLFIYFIILLPECLNNMKYLKKITMITIYIAFFLIMVYQLQGNYSGVLEYDFY